MSTDCLCFYESFCLFKKNISRLQDKFAHAHEERKISEIVGNCNGPAARPNLFLPESERMGERRLKGDYGSPQQAGRLMDASEGPRMRSRGEAESLGGAATDCADVLFRSGDYYRPAVALLLTGSPCFPSSLFFPLLISAAVECSAAALEEGKRRFSEFRQLDGVCSSRCRSRL